jgi:DNA (cytosine-5)-methyltransferase 1
MADTQIDGREQRRTQPNRGSVVGGGGTCGVGNSVVAGLEGYTRHEHDGNKSQRITANQVGSAPKAGGSSHWDSFDILRCTDGKARRIEPGTFPLAHGIPGRVGLLRGYGNAIVPQIAAEFIKAFQEIT